MSMASLVPAVGAAIGATAGLFAAGATDGLQAGQSFFSSLQAALHPGASDESQASEAMVDESLESGDGSTERLLKLQREVDDLHRRLLRRLTALGVDLSTPVQLKSDNEGKVIVDDPHPQRAAVEQLFAQDRELSAAFQYLAAAYSAEGTIRGTVDENGWGEFRLQLDEGGGQVVFE